MTRLAFGAKCGNPGRPPSTFGARALCEQVALQQFRQGGHADTDTGLAEKAPPASRRLTTFQARIHGYSFITTSFRLRMRLVTLV